MNSKTTPISLLDGETDRLCPYGVANRCQGPACAAFVFGKERTPIAAFMESPDAKPRDYRIAEKAACLAGWSRHPDTDFIYGVARHWTRPDKTKGLCVRVEADAAKTDVYR